MALLHVHKLNNKKVLGVGLIESLIALALFSGVLALYVRQTESVNDYKKAKVYSDQTNVFARDFANQLLQVNSQTTDFAGKAYQDNLLITKYKNDLIAKNKAGQTAMQIVTLNDWDNKSLFNETPCLLLYYDNAGKQNEMSGLLYYVTKKNVNIKNKELITLKAISENNAYNSAYFKDNSSILSTSKNKNGDNIVSNNGWGINTNIIRYIKNNACGSYGTLADNSLLLNMQLIPEFNNRLVSVSGLQKTSDQSYSVNLQSNSQMDNRFLPGHLYNNNTFKSNLSLTDSVILDKNPDNLITKTINVMGATQAAALASSTNYVNNGCIYADTGSKNPPPANSSKNCSLSIVSADRLNPNRTCRVGNTYSCPTGDGGVTAQSACADNPSANSALINIGCTYVSNYNRGDYHDGECTAQDIAEGSRANYMYSMTCPLGKGSVDPVSMSMAYGSGNNTTLNFGKISSADNSAFITSAIQPNISIKTGTQCQDLELGKVAIAQKETISQSGQADSDLARNLVTCSKNATLCSTGYCYLPIKSTTFSFSNPNGLQDDNSGIFRCPAYAPYVVSFSSALVQPNVDVFTNNGGTTTSSFFKTVVGDDGNGNPNVTYSNIGNNNKYFSRWYNCSGGCNRGLWAFLRTMDFSEANIIHGSRLSIATVSVEKIYNSSGNGLQSPIGLKATSTFSNCDNVCSSLSSPLGGIWGNISTIAPGIGSGTAYTGIPSNKCACGKVGGQSDYWIYGIALIENVNTNITNVICSNYPEYKFQ